MKNYYKSELINKLLELYSAVFTITELAGGLQYAMKCKECNRSTEMKPRKLLVYKEIPWAVCSFCFGDKVKTFPLIKKASKGVFNIKSSKNDFLTKNGLVKLKCIENGHSITTISPVKFCQQCYDNKEHFYIKKTIKKNTTVNDYYKRKDEFILKIKSLSQKNVLESLKSLFSENSKKFVINLGAFKRFNIRKVLRKLNVNYVEQDGTLTFSVTVESSKGSAVPKDDSTVTENVTIIPESVDENTTIKYLGEFKVLPEEYIIENSTQKLINEELPREIMAEVQQKLMTEEPSSIPNIIEHTDDNFKHEEEISISSQPTDTFENIEVEMNYSDHMELFDRHDKFMEEYYRELGHCGPIIKDEKTRHDYELFKKACDEKYYEFDPVLYNIICELNNNVCHHETEEYVNHSFNDFKYSFNTGFFDNFEHNFLYTPSPIFPIVDRRITDEYLLDKPDLDVEKLEVSQLFDTPDDVRQTKEVVEIIKSVKKEVSLFFSFGFEREKSTLMEDLEILKLIKKDFFLTDLVIKELLASEYSRENDNYEMMIDPVGIVTIILCLMNERSSPYLSYFSKSKNIVYDNKNRVYLQRDNGHVLLSKRAAQKILYIDSGVAALFWKIVFYHSRLENYDVLTTVPSDLIKYCPESMFGITERNVAGVLCDNINIIGYLDCSYNFVEFLTQSLLDNTRPGYRQRVFMCRAIMMISGKGIKEHTKSSISDFLKKYMQIDSQFCILNEKEKETLSNYNASFADIMIDSEIKNIFAKQILSEKDAKVLGTILYPRCTIYSKDEELPKDFFRKHMKFL